MTNNIVVTPPSGISDKFTNSPFWYEYEHAISSFNLLPWEKAQDPEVAMKVLEAWIVGCVGFFRLSEALREYAGVIEGRDGPFLDGNKTLSTLKSLVFEENNVGIAPEKPDHRPHIDAAIKCLDHAGLIDTAAKLRKIITPVSKLTDDEQEKFTGNKVWDEFLMSLVQYGMTLDTSIGVMALGHEMVVTNIRKAMEANFPDDRRLGFVEEVDTDNGFRVDIKGSGFKHFNFRHLRADGDPNGHGDLMAILAEDWVEDPDLALQAAAQYLRNRQALLANALGIEIPIDHRPCSYNELTPLERELVGTNASRLGLPHGASMPEVFAGRTSNSVAL
jgi:hypothetical protein